MPKKYTKKQRKAYAKELFFALNDNGKHQYSNRCIAKMVTKKCNEYVSNTTIGRWSKEAGDKGVSWVLELAASKAYGVAKEPSIFEGEENPELLPEEIQNIEKMVNHAVVEREEKTIRDAKKLSGLAREFLIASLESLMGTVKGLREQTPNKKYSEIEYKDILAAAYGGEKLALAIEKEQHERIVAAEEKSKELGDRRKGLTKEDVDVLREAFMGK